MLRDREDDNSGSFLFCVGPADAPRASLRITVWQPGTLPSEYVEKYSMKRFPDYATRTIGLAAFLVENRTVRGSISILSLMLRL